MLKPRLIIICYTSKRSLLALAFFASTEAPTEPAEDIDKDVIYATVISVLVVMMASGVAYVIIKQKRRKLALYFFLKEALNDQGPLVQRVDSNAHRIKHYPLNNSIDFVRSFPVDSSLYAKKRFLTYWGQACIFCFYLDLK